MRNTKKSFVRKLMARLLPVQHVLEPSFFEEKQALAKRPPAATRPRGSAANRALLTQSPHNPEQPRVASVFDPPKFSSPKHTADPDRQDFPLSNLRAAVP